MARARPAASSRRASESRTASFACASASPRRTRKYGPMTITRPVSLPPADRGRSAAPSRLRGSNQVTLKPEHPRPLEQLDRSAGHDGGDRMLVDKLRMTVAPKQQTEVVEPR